MIEAAERILNVVTNASFNTSTKTGYPEGRVTLEYPVL